ncbi:hypothetical protein DVH24_006223 [Malus domestica]|uniref:Uncharacterized protein n=1 Tax=Malus domestica TaxID=3750 RepID=A0A498KC84_MALDO|nr:hypothetical protein DVH24_006223 [Malus domestica]
MILTWQILFLMLPVPQFELIECRMTEIYCPITAENELSIKIWTIRAQCKASCKHGKKPRHSSTRGSSIFHFRLISTCPPSIRFLAILLLHGAVVHVCEFLFRCVWGSEVNALLRDGCQLIPHIFYVFTLFIPTPPCPARPVTVTDTKSASAIDPLTYTQGWEAMLLWDKDRQTEGEGDRATERKGEGGVGISVPLLQILDVMSDSPSAEIENLKYKGENLGYKSSVQSFLAVVHVCEFLFRCVWGSKVNALLRDGCQLILHIFYFNEMELNS